MRLQLQRDNIAVITSCFYDFVILLMPSVQNDRSSCLSLWCVCGGVCVCVCGGVCRVVCGCACVCVCVWWLCCFVLCGVCVCVCVCVYLCISDVFCQESIARSCKSKDMGNQYAGQKTLQRERRR